MSTLKERKERGRKLEAKALKAVSKLMNPKSAKVALDAAKPKKKGTSKK